MNIKPEKEFPDSAFGKRLEYSIETGIYVKIPTPLIEKIEIQRKSLVS
ncbi:MAG: hypothetical protein QXD82_05195 [Nitrososphaerales archaeon]